MYDRLGDLLSGCIDRGEIPSAKEKKSADNPPEAAGKPAIPEKLRAEFALLGFPESGAGKGSEADSPAELPELQQVRSAYAALLKKAHPDTAPEGSCPRESAERIAELASAFNRIREWYG